MEKMKFNDKQPVEKKKVAPPPKFVVERREKKKEDAASEPQDHGPPELEPKDDGHDGQDPAQPGAPKILDKKPKFRQIIRCPYEGCHKVYTSTHGLQYHFDNFDHGYRRIVADDPTKENTIVAITPEDTPVAFETHKATANRAISPETTPDKPITPETTMMKAIAPKTTTPKTTTAKTITPKATTVKAPTPLSSSSPAVPKKVDFFLERPDEGKKARDLLVDHESPWFDRESTQIAMTLEEEETTLRLLQANRASLHDFQRRLLRKLAVRDVVRTARRGVFDLDAIVDRYLASKGPTVLLAPVRKSGHLLSVLEPLQAGANPKVAAVAPQENLSVQELPTAAIKNYKRSFWAMTYGDGYRTLTIPAIAESVYSTRRLRPFITRDYDMRPLRMRLHEELLRRINGRTSDWRPEPRQPVDFCYFGREHLTSVNRFLCEFFWPGIDMSEALFTPEYSIVVCYRRLVVGCAFITPDGYISFIAVHPEWRGMGIATFMIYHLIQACVGRDITLHVSASNSAMILYQKFGFKPEQYIVNFYDKYLPDGSTECKHAFYIRLRR